MLVPRNRFYERDADRLVSGVITLCSSIFFFLVPIGTARAVYGMYSVHAARLTAVSPTEIAQQMVEDAVKTCGWLGG